MSGWSIDEKLNELDQNGESENGTDFLTQTFESGGISNLDVRRMISERSPIGLVARTVSVISEGVALALLKSDGNSFELGRIALVGQKYPQAIEHFTRALEKDPKNYRALHNLGLIYETLGQIKKALFYYDAAVKLGSQRSIPYFCDLLEKEARRIVEKFYPRGNTSEAQVA